MNNTWNEFLDHAVDLIYDPQHLNTLISVFVRAPSTRARQVNERLRHGSIGRAPRICVGLTKVFVQARYLLSCSALQSWAGGTMSFTAGQLFL